MPVYRVKGTLLHGYQRLSNPFNPQEVGRDNVQRVEEFIRRPGEFIELDPNAPPGTEEYIEPDELQILLEDGIIEPLTPREEDEENLDTLTWSELKDIITQRGEVGALNYLQSLRLTARSLASLRTGIGRNKEELELADAFLQVIAEKAAEIGK